MRRTYKSLSVNVMMKSWLSHSYQQRTIKGSTPSPLAFHAATANVETSYLRWNCAKIFACSWSLRMLSCRGSVNRPNLFLSDDIQSHCQTKRKQAKSRLSDPTPSQKPHGATRMSPLRWCCTFYSQTKSKQIPKILDTRRKILDAALVAFFPTLTAHLNASITNLTEIYKKYVSHE